MDNITIDGNTISSSNNNGNIILAPNGSGQINVNNSKIINVAEPTANSHVATKSYVDATVQGLDIKESVKVATTDSFTMASTASATTLVLANGEGGFDNSADTLTIDGISLSQNDRVLIKDGVNSASTGVNHKWNGIYTVGALDGTTLTLSRASDAYSNDELTGGTFVFVEQGNVNANNGFVFTHNGTPTLGSTALTVSQFSGAGSIAAGTGLSINGNELSVNGSQITTVGALNDGSITSGFGSINNGTSTLSCGVLTAATGSTIGNLTLANGSITDDSGSISFGNENLTTTGTLGCGVLTAATGSTIGNLTLADGSITDSAEK